MWWFRYFEESGETNHILNGFDMYAMGQAENENNGEAVCKRWYNTGTYIGPLYATYIESD